MSEVPGISDSVHIFMCEAIVGHGDHVVGAEEERKSMHEYISVYIYVCMHVYIYIYIYIYICIYACIRM